MSNDWEDPTSPCQKRLGQDFTNEVCVSMSANQVVERLERFVVCRETASHDVDNCGTRRTLSLVQTIVSNDWDDPTSPIVKRPGEM